jgi:hypothetical protein
MAASMVTLPAVAWAQVPLGAEFRANTHTTSLQAGASVASDGFALGLIFEDGFEP